MAYLELVLPEARGTAEDCSRRPKLAEKPSSSFVYVRNLPTVNPLIAFYLITLCAANISLVVT